MLLRNSTGEKVRIADYEPAFVDAMNRLHESQPGLFSVGTCLENFSLRRSMCRGAVCISTTPKCGGQFNYSRSIRRPCEDGYGGVDDLGSKRVVKATEVSRLVPHD